MVGFFGRNGIVQICTYSTDAAFPEADAKYQQVAKSFHFDPAFAFDDSENSIKLIAISTVGLGVVIAAIVGVVLVVRASSKRPAIPFAAYGDPQQPAPPQGWVYPGVSARQYPPPPPQAGQ